jgi:2-amino-4-hydroxy-6-hydroxymethyldihydropteridine diphosphokinase
MIARWQPAYIGIGSNLNSPRLQVERAFEALGTLAATRLIARSALYGSRPLGPVTEQPDFVNAVAGVLTQLAAPDLLRALKALEISFGRAAEHAKWGPRIIDLDLLVHGRERRADPELTLPHPGIVERNWVLYPLADIAPDLDVPGVGPVSELAQRVASGGIWTLSVDQ